MIASVEEVALKITKTQAVELRGKVRQALEKVKPSKSNITIEESLAIKTLQ